MLSLQGNQREEEMKKTCGTCKYRGKEEKIGIAAPLPTSYFLCKRIKHDKNWKYKQGQGALVTDGSGYYAALCVETDFGCVKWEGK